MEGIDGESGLQPSAMQKAHMGLGFEIGLQTYACRHSTAQALSFRFVSGCLPVSLEQKRCSGAF